jgi:hypothetical protein
MWPFNAARPKRDLAELDERLERLERSQRDVALDWESTYEKFRQLLMRLNKRDQRAAEGSDIAPVPTNGSGRVQEINQRILDRRAHRGSQR